MIYDQTSRQYAHLDLPQLGHILQPSVCITSDPHSGHSSSIFIHLLGNKHIDHANISLNQGGGDESTLLNIDLNIL